MIDITHPAHVHFFRNAITHWKNNGDQLLITSRYKDVTYDLLDTFDIPHVKVGKTVRSGLTGLALELVERGWQIQRLARDFKPDVATAIGGTFIAYGMIGQNVPVVIFTDTEAKLANRITFPFATKIFTPTAFKQDIGEKHTRYQGYHEFAYTHPDRFTPDPSCLVEEGLAEGEPFTIVRMVNWGASHDIGHHSVQDYERLVNTLAAYGRVIVSSEKPLPDSIKHMQMVGSKGNMLHLQAFARLLIGDGATMISECAMLGTPAIYLSTVEPGTIYEQEHRYHMIYSFHNPIEEYDDALKKAIELITDPNVPQQWQEKRNAMLSELADVNSIIINQVYNTAK